VSGRGREVAAAASVSRRVAKRAESVCARRIRARATSAMIDSVSGRGTVGIAGVGCCCERGTTTIETIAVTNVPAVIATMKTDRRSAFRALFASQTGRAMTRLKSRAGVSGVEGERRSDRTTDQSAKGGRECARLPFPCFLRLYFTVTEPFMLFAMCGVQM
jgi:hypothetical protein